MAHLRLFISKTSDQEQTASGDIWTKTADDHDPPVVSDVNARIGAASFFTLPSGDYVYRFAASRDGTFTVEIAIVAGSKVMSKDYDTVVGKRGRTLNFTVK